MNNMKIALNIGLDSKLGPNSPGSTYQLVSGILGEITRSRIAQSTTEKTLVCEVETRFDLLDASAAIHQLSNILNQDCIAWKHDGAGYLTGPNSAAWQPFNQEFWLEISDAVKPDPQAALRDIWNQPEKVS